jgi:phosphoglycolate phosphatase
VYKINIQAVLTDFNGVIPADTRACLEACNAVMKHFGGKILSLKEFQHHNSIPTIDFYSSMGCDRDQLLSRSEEVSAVFHDCYEPRAAACRTRRGVRRGLGFLKQYNIPTAVVSNHTREGIESQLRRLQLTKMFTEILCHDNRSGTHLKRSKREWVGDYLSRTGYKPANVIFIGDSDEEIHVGKEFGLITVAITDGYYSDARLIAEKPDYLIRNFGKIVPIVLNQAHRR